MRRSRAITCRLAADGSAVIDVEGRCRAWLDDIEARYVPIRPGASVARTADSPERLRKRFGKAMKYLSIPAASKVPPE